MMLSALAVPRRSALSVAALPDGKLPKDTVVILLVLVVVELILDLEQIHYTPE